MGIGRIRWFDYYMVCSYVTVNMLGERGESGVGTNGDRGGGSENKNKLLTLNCTGERKSHYKNVAPRQVWRGGEEEE